MKKIFTLGFALMSVLSSWAQSKVDMQEVPMDTAIRYGVLDNGLTYYVRRATMTKDNAEFRLVQKTGSLIEEKNELGMAHFLEHMQFRGTKHFPGRGILDFLRRNGIAFGPDINAFTGYETTVYQLSQVPVAREGLMDSCLQILRDWSADCTINPADLDAERNVVVEEQRARSSQSVALNFLQKVFEGTRYGDRNPIGDMKVIQSCTAQQMQKFYQKWYQPQNQCVIVCGDFDPYEVEAKIKAVFGSLERGKTKVPTYALPDFGDKPLVLIDRDKNQSYVKLELNTRIDLPSQDEMLRLGYFRQRELNKQACDVVTRYNLMPKMKSDHDGIVMGMANITSFFNSSNQADMARYEITAFPDNYKEGIKHGLINLERLKRFTYDELNLQFPLADSLYVNDEETLVLNFNVPATSDQDNVDALGATNNIIEHFLKGTRGISPATNGVLWQFYTKHITQDMRKEALRQLFGHQNRVIVLSIPDNSDIPTPTEEEVLSWFDEVENMELEPWKDEEPMKRTVKIHDISHINPTPGEIVKIQQLKDVDFDEYTLSNGVKVILNRKKEASSNENAEEELPKTVTDFRALLWGGKTILEDDEVGYQSFINSPVVMNPQSSKSWGVGIPMGEAYTNYIFSAANGELEDEFKRFYLRLTETEIDETEFEKQKKNLRDEALLPKSQLAEIAMKSVTLDMAPTPRTQSLTAEQVDQLSISGLRKVMDRLHSNYNGMIMFIDNQMDRDSLLLFIKKYVASLPSLAKPVAIVDRASSHIKPYDDSMVEYVENEAPLAEVIMRLNQEKDLKYSASLYAHAEAFNMVLNQVLTNNIRIKNSDTYSVVTNQLVHQYPVPYQSFMIDLTCKPEKAEAIIADIKALIKEMAEGDLITPQLLQAYHSAKENQKARGILAASNGIKVGGLLDEMMTQYELDGVVKRVINGEDIYDEKAVEGVTIASLRQFAKDLYTKGHIYNLVVRTK